MLFGILARFPEASSRYGSPHEPVGHILVGSEVAWRIERQRRDDGATVGIVAVAAIDTADGEKGPSGRVPGIGDIAGGGLEEVELVDGTVVDGARENGEELQQDASSEDHQRGQTQN